MRPLIVYLLIINTSLNFAADDFWLSPTGPYSGIVNKIITDKEGNIYIGTNAGIFFSDNRGESWIPRHFKQTNVKVLAIDSDSTLFGSAGYGLFTSTDRGINWELVWSKNLSFDDITVLIDNTIFVSSSYYDIEIGSSWHSIYRSVDLGLHWEHNGGDLFYSNRIHLLRSHGSLSIFAGSVYGTFPGFSGDLYRSLDGGNSWLITSLQDKYVNDIAFYSDGRMLVATRDAGLFLSSDEGNTWISLNIETINDVLTTLHFDDEQTLFAGTSTSGIYLSNDEGENWFSSDLTNVGVNDVISDSGYYFAGTDNGIYISHNKGLTWYQSNEGLSISNVPDLLVTPTNRILAGHSGISYSDDSGLTWNKSDMFAGYIDVLSLAPDGTIYAGIFQQGVWKSSDDGLTWSQTNLKNVIIRELVVNLNGDVFAGNQGGGLFRSTDGGNSWTSLSLPYPYIYALTCNSRNHIFITAGTSIYKSIDNGESWHVIRTNISGLGFGLWIDDNDVIYSPTWDELYKSENNGQSWSKLNWDKPYINSIVFPDNRTLIIGRNSGVFISQDGGNSWEDFSSNLLNGHVRSLVIDYNGYLYAGTNGNGIQRSINRIKTKNGNIPGPIINSIKSYILYQNYPNPFNSTTEIQFSIVQPGNVVIEIFDLSGQKIRTLIDKYYSEGIYTTAWDGLGDGESSISSGVYFYTLNHDGKFISVSKMVYIK